MINENSINVTPSSKTMTVGDSEFATASSSSMPSTNIDVTWSSDDPNVATVNPNSGLIYAKNPGTTTIRATAQDGSGATGVSNITVTEQIYVEDIVLSVDSVRIHKGESYQLEAYVYPDNATTKTIRWYSNRPAIARVNSKTGEITGRSAGRATICAVAMDGSEVAACCSVVVRGTVVTSAEETPVSKSNKKTSKGSIDIYTGAHLINNTLMSLFGGQGIKLVANYDSTQLANGMLGLGWYHNYEKRIYVNGSVAKVYNNPSSFSYYTADNSYNTRFTCLSKNKNGYVLTIDHTREYPYIIDCNSGITEYYDAYGDIAKIKDHQGFETLISYDGFVITITDRASGKKIYLKKNSNCKVERVYDDAGRSVTLSYTNNLLTSIYDVNGNTITYTYDDECRVLSSIDPYGVSCFQNTYDEYGRIASQKDALNHTSYFAYSEGEEECNEVGIRTVTNKNGKKSYYTYNSDGLLIKYKDENGNIKTYAYDARYNITNETDAKGRSILKTYNNFNKPNQITDRKGNTTYFTYDSKGNVTKIVYPEINGVAPQETFVYNSRNQMTQHTDIRGLVTVYTYSANGMPASKKVGNKNAIVYSYQNGLLKSETDARNNTTTYDHNNIGQVISRTDAENNVTQYTYNKSGHLLSTVDANGNTIKTTYNCNYLKTSVKDANGNITRYSYNANMKNNKVTLPDENVINYVFDNEGRITRVIDQQASTTDMAYDNAGRLIRKEFADGAIFRYEYDEVGNVVKETNPKWGVVTKTYDSLGNVLRVKDHEGNITSYEYNAMSKVKKVTNAIGGTISYTYSKAGDLLTETDSFGNTKTYTYDMYGNMLTATDANNNTTTYTYDENNNLLTVEDALGRITTYTYNSLNQCVSVKDALNNVIQYGYDALGRRTTITDARGNVFTTFYDGNGNVIKTTDAKQNVISETVYNCLNQPLTVIDAMGKETDYTYNELGKVESVTDSLGHCTQFYYDNRGRNTSVRDAANNTSTATYDSLGNVTCLAGPLGGATNYTYDIMGRLVSESTTSGGTVQYTYNALNVRNKITNARGQVRDVTYDSMGRITSYTSPEGTVSYTYDANSNVLTVTDSNGTITRTYDALNRVVSYKDTYGKSIRYRYDAVGNLSKLTYPDNTYVTYNYDANHNLIRVDDWANRVTSYTYDENNRVVGVTKPDGSVTTTVYDNKQRVTSTVERTASGVVITGFEYTYDDLSRIVEEKVLANSTKMCYTYDNLSRVTKRTVKDMSDVVLSEESFTYDAAGNVTGAPNSSFVYDTNNRLTSFNGNAVSYDADGNMLSNGTLTCTYDSANRLITAGGHTYTYNAEDVRIRNLCEEYDTTYVYNTNCKLSQLLMKTTNGVVTKYVYGIGLIGEEKQYSFKTYHFDCRGSTIAITDENGNITDTFAYDTYGKLISRTGTNFVIFGYNGRDGVVTDKNGLIYMRARYYSPEMRRFVNADIISGKLTNAVTLNRYAYANANPVTNVDPTGRFVGALIAGVVLLGALAIGLTASSNEEEATPEISTERDSTRNRQSRTESTSATSNTTSAPAIPSTPVEKENPPTEANKIEDNVGAKISVGKEETCDIQYHIFTTVEKGVGYSKDFGDEKPVTLFASAGENWWEFWEWSVGIDVNINGYGGGFSIGGETSLNIHAGDVSHEVGINAIGRLSHKVVAHNGDAYVYSEYSLNLPETAAVGIGLYYATPYVVPALTGMMSSVGGAQPIYGG